MKGKSHAETGSWMQLYTQERCESDPAARPRGCRCSATLPKAFSWPVPSGEAEVSPPGQHQARLSTETPQLLVVRAAPGSWEGGRQPSPWVWLQRLGRQMRDPTAFLKFVLLRGSIIVYPGRAMKEYSCERPALWNIAYPSDSPVQKIKRSKTALKRRCIFKQKWHLQKQDKFQISVVHTVRLPFSLNTYSRTKTDGTHQNKYKAILCRESRMQWWATARYL